MAEPQSSRALSMWLVWLLLGAGAPCITANILNIPLSYETDDYLVRDQIAAAVQQFLVIKFAHTCSCCESSGSIVPLA